MEIIEIHTESLNLTEEQFYKFCVENKGLRIERDKNKTIIILAPTGGETGNSNGEIFGETRDWNKVHKLGYTFDSSTGFKLSNNAVRSPDVSWVAKERWENLPREDRKHFPPICPDFVIELVSESDSLKLQKDKMEEWLENGCRLGWLINPENRMTTVYKSNVKPTEIPFSEMLTGEDVLPGFELMVGKIILE